MPSIKVMIVDDHEVVRMGLRAALESEDGIEVAGEAGNGESSVRDAPIVRPDVVLMDVMMPGMDGVEACRHIRDRLPDTKVVILTSNETEEAVMTAIMAGACGYLLKNTGRAALVAAVRSAAAGDSLLDPAVTNGVLDQFRRMVDGQQNAGLAALSDREQEVLKLVAEGLTNSEIAGRLFISPNTARNHVGRILAKLGLSRRSEAAAYAAEHGLTRKPPED